MAIKFLSDLDVSGKLNLNDNFLENIKIQHLATNPDPIEGQIYYNTTNNVLMVCNGTSGTTGAATVNLDSSTVSAISANTSKTGLSSAQASAITANTAKTGITTAQAEAITSNSAKAANAAIKTIAITTPILIIGV